MGHGEELLTKMAWSTPELVFDGHLADLVQGGSGKFSVATADMGDSLKPSGQA